MFSVVGAPQQKDGRCFLPIQKFRVVASVTTLGDFCTLDDHSKLVATIILPKWPTLLGNFCKGFKNFHFSCEIIFGQLLKTFGDFHVVTLIGSIETDQH